MSVDTFLLSRLQFALNISFHILFPTITIALAWVLVFFKFNFHRTADNKWMRLYFFFTKIFALTFSLGVVSGITMSFQFGTNWPGYMNTVGNIAGPLLAYEVLTAFFLEATFLGVMLFGFRKVKAWVHNLATLLVALGTTLSAFWILALNSWMHTPQGFEMIQGVAHAKDWFEVVFNPSMPYRFTHTLLASFLTVSALMGGLLGFRYLMGERSTAVKTGLKVAFFLGAVLMPLQMIVGDLHGMNTLKYQPAKIAAMESLWETQEGAPLVLFAIPDEIKRTNHFEIAIPYLASLIATRKIDGKIQGLNDFMGEHPPVSPVFWSFRLMIGMGMLMWFVSLFGVYWTKWRKKELPFAYQKILVVMTFSGWIATLAGWYVTEIGRQPWLVSGLLKASDAASLVPSSNVAFTLTLYTLTYALLLMAYIKSLFYLSKKELLANAE